MERARPATPRKLGVTVSMLEWIKDHLKPAWPAGRRTSRAVEEKIDEVVLYAAVLFGWFFLCRAGEYVRSGPQEEGRVFRGVDVKVFRDDGRWRTDVQFRKTKTDQQAFGCVRTQYEVQGKREKEVCVVEALRMMRAWLPARFDGGAEAQRPLFRWHDGRQVRREDLQKVLQQAAEAVGLPKERFKSHSLRIGGASAMLHATRQFDLVKRFGRWSSDAVHVYLHDSAEQSLRLASQMSRDRSSVHYT